MLPGLSSPWHELKPVISKVVLVLSRGTQCCVLLAAEAGSPKTMTLIAVQEGTEITFPFVCHVKGWCGFSLVPLKSPGPEAAVSDKAGVTPDCCGNAGAETSGAAAAVEGVRSQALGLPPLGLSLGSGGCWALGTMPPLETQLSVYLSVSLSVCL